jgi:hypothetical protein
MLDFALRMGAGDLTTTFEHKSATKSARCRAMRDAAQPAVGGA